jgi:serine phosphatase RsbU (regulator of sigma subunit)
MQGRIRQFQHQIGLNRAVLDDSVLTNVRRLFVVAVVAFPLHLAHIALFLFATPATTPAQIAWKQGILSMHGASAVFMLLAAVLLFFLRRKEAVHRLMHVTIAAFLVWFPTLGILLVAYDQYVTTNITPFLVVCMALGFLPVIRPSLSLIVFAASYAAFYFAIALVQEDPAILLTNRVNGLTFAAIGFVLSTILWHQYRRSILQHRQIVEQSRELRERNQMIERELDMARLIQQKLLPASPPHVAGFTIAAACLSMDKVGGDFYDLTPYPRGLGVFLGDVSGHGIPAAFLASVAKTAFDFSSWATESPSRVLGAMNEVIADRSVSAMFVTAVFARLSDTGIEGATAGHWPPIIFRTASNSFVQVSGRGRPLGFGGEKPYKDFAAALLPRDRIIFFTDGILETRNSRGELFGEDRLLSLIQENTHLNAGQFLERVFRETHEFAQGAGLTDDATLVVVDVTGPDAIAAL